MSDSRELSKGVVIEKISLRQMLEVFGVLSNLCLSAAICSSELACGPATLNVALYYRRQSDALDYGRVVV